MTSAGDGIIPAYAGNTDVKSKNANDFRDHPRICGEHLLPKAPTGTAAGSSPHMRGTREDRRTIGQTVGIIPAYAGNTHGQNICNGPSGDHPRICGEHTKRL